MLRILQITCIFVVFYGTPTSAQSPAAFPNYNTDVLPILVKHCILCHGPGKQESNYRVDRIANLLSTGSSELPAIVPGDPLKSHLWQRISSNEDAERMPPKGQGLSSDEKARIRTWIEAGARTPTAVINNAKTDHWSFQALQNPTPPILKNPESAINEVDAFVLAKLEPRRLSLSAPADKYTLIRRIYLIMLGLQPTEQEIKTFVNDESPDAYHRLVEDILSSPHYGERWAQHWLDCVRYAESTGYEINKSIPNIYPYRDYVIQAFNADLPYDQFIREQIAGDAYRKDAATGFLMVGPHDTNPSPDPRLTAMQFQDGHDEIIKTVSAVTMGLTLGCARCHDHKFDPLTQHDYYRIQSIFAGVSYGSRVEQGDDYDRMKTEADRLKPEIERLTENAATLQEQTGLQQAIDLREYDEHFSAVETNRIRFLINRTNDGSNPELDDVEIWTVATDNESSINVAHRDYGAVATSSPTAKGNQGKGPELLIDGSRQLLLYFKAADKQNVWIEIQLNQSHLIDRITIKPRGRAVPTDYRIQIPSADEGWKTIKDSRHRYPHLTDTGDIKKIQLLGVTDKQKTAIVQNSASLRAVKQQYDELIRGRQLYVGRLHTPRKTHLMEGGDPEKPGAVVAPGFLSALSDIQLDDDSTDIQRRKALGDAIASKSNPLTARVITNRIWQHYFGTGIVDTPSDFGLNGGRPSHGQLLDWLATYLIEHNWSLKQLHRKLLLSATFRQASHTKPEAFSIDANSRLLWRFPPQRLEGEVLRDMVLQASGKLNTKQFGEPFKFFEETTNQFAKRVPLKTFDETGWRRMIYGEKVRLTQVGIFGVFDCPDGSQMTPKRSVSTSAVQALALFNSEFVNRQAQFMADDISSQFPDDTEKQIICAFERILSRRPTQQELQQLVPFVEDEGLHHLGRILFNLNEFVFIN